MEQHSASESRTVLVTGAGRGIGRAVAARFAAHGDRVVLHYHQSRPQAEALVRQLKEEGVPAEHLLLCRADLRQTADIEQLIQKATHRFGKIDILINNAGIGWNGLLTDMSETEWDQLFAVNVKAVFTACRLVLPQMIQRKRGKIINISSMWGQAGASCEVAYAASKGALDAFTKGLALEVAPSGITVNAVSPGVIATDINAHLSPRELAALAAETPLGRIGQPEEIAAAVFFLAGADADFITGQILPVNGGFITA